MSTGIGVAAPTQMLNVGTSGMAGLRGLAGTKRKMTVEERAEILWVKNAESLLAGKGPLVTEENQKSVGDETFKRLVDEGYLIRDEAAEATALALSAEKVEKTAEALGADKRFLVNRIPNGDLDIYKGPAETVRVEREVPPPPRLYRVGRFEESRALIEVVEGKGPLEPTYIDNYRAENIPSYVAADIRSSGRIALAGYRAPSKRGVLHVYWHQDDYNIIVNKNSWDTRLSVFPKKLEAERVRWVLREIVDQHAEWAYRRELMSCGVLEKSNVSLIHDPNNSNPDGEIPLHVLGQLNADLPGQDIEELGNIPEILTKYDNLRKRLDMIIGTLGHWAPKLEALRRGAVASILDQAAVWVAFQRPENEESLHGTATEERRKEHAEFMLAHSDVFSYDTLFNGDPAPMRHRTDGPSVDMASEAAF